MIQKKLACCSLIHTDTTEAAASSAGAWGRWMQSRTVPGEGARLGCVCGVQSARGDWPCGVLVCLCVLFQHCPVTSMRTIGISPHAAGRISGQGRAALAGRCGWRMHSANANVAASGTGPAESGTGHPRTADHTHTAGNGQATPNAPGLQLRSSWQPRAGLLGSCRGQACAWILPALRRRRFNFRTAEAKRPM